MEAAEKAAIALVVASTDTEVIISDSEAPIRNKTSGPISREAARILRIQEAGEGGNPKELSTTFCGSEAYAPPEVLQGIRYRPKKADVWSLGVILFVMVTGLLPYESECVPRQVRLQMTRTLRFPQVLPLSYQLKNLIRGMLEPVATLRSSMARVLRHPWVRMFPTAMAE
nr:testis-specific serine/threonine-protein kinase 1-like [Dermacentor andersoni]